MRRPLTIVLSSVVLAACAATATSDTKPFGGPQSVAYAGKLWGTLSDAGLAGPGAAVSKPYEGQHPHGAVLDTIERPLTVDGHTGVAIVKRNYGGEGVSIQNVYNDPGKYLKSVTVMYRREAGYDPDNANWFWAKYKPDGSLDTNPKGMKLAGRVAKGMNAGCIACHTGAPGGDYVFNHNRYAQ